MYPKTLNQAIIQEQEREQHIEALSRLSEEMRNKGASQRSIYTVLTDYNEYLLVASRPFFWMK